MSDDRHMIDGLRDVLETAARGEAERAADDESKPMTRTELAMLWDLLNRWAASHTTPGFPLVASADLLARNIDAELAERFGG